ncbi:MAG: protein jag [Vallitaleaceae bacterium]|nr:protein jag [Vallitaleaceae bacterium]
MNYVIKEARSVEDAITEALVELGITSEEAVIEIVEKQSGGLFGIFSTKLAKVKVSKSATIDTIAESFLTDVFKEMELEVSVSIKMDEEMNMNIDLSGPNMGVLIGKRGQTLDSLQYLVSLVVNKESEQYIRVKLDTEAYRERRKQTLENLAKNLANKVKKSGKKFTLEPMNPYERRIIHFTLQNNKAVETHSEGEEPYRKVIIVPSKQK